MCYHGVWFMPQFILNFLYKTFKRKNKFPLYVFSYIMESVFVVRNFKIISWPSRAILKWRQKGFVYVAKFILSKLKRIIIDRKYIPPSTKSFKYESKL